MTTDEDTSDLVVELGSIIGLNIKREDISVSHRLPVKMYSQAIQNKDALNPGRSNIPRIIVKFVRREIKDQFYHSRKKLKDKTTRDLGLSRFAENKIYISESLSRRKKELFNECLKFKREWHFKFIWTNSGKIYLRKDSTSPVRIISSLKNLEDLDHNVVSTTR